MEGPLLRDPNMTFATQYAGIEKKMDNSLKAIVDGVFIKNAYKTNLENIKWCKTMRFRAHTLICDLRAKIAHGKRVEGV